MKIRKTGAILAALALTAAALSGCGNGNGDDAGTTPAPDATEPAGDAGDDDPTPPGDDGEVIVLRWAAWDLDRSTEFHDLAETFNATHDGIYIELVDYPNAEWEVVMTADLAAGAAPELVTIRTINNNVLWGGAGQLHDVSDLVADLDPATAMADIYRLGDGIWGVPFRADHWMLYYNIDLFEEAGVDLPDGSWTWDDFHDVAVQLRDNLPDGVLPNYQHNWASTVSAFAHVQTLPAVDIFDGDMSWLAPFYEWAIARDNEGLQPNFGEVTTGSLHHLAEFGQQRVAMVPMGSWFMAQILDPEQDTQDFRWGVAPVPQFDRTTTGMGNVPTTVGGPTGVGINASVSGAQLEAARTFLSWVAGPEGAMVLAQRGQLAPLMTDAAMAALTGAPGMPSDELSLFAIGTRTVGLENRPDPRTGMYTQILGEFHTNVMSQSVTIEEGIRYAEATFEEEIG
jgi:multiple sugar transport system substrate-binding protein